MRRLFKVGIVILVVGLVALGVGFFKHGNQNVTFNGSRPQITQTQRNRTVKVNRSFHKVDVDVATADVTVTRGKKFQIIYRGKNVPQISVKHGQATIHQTSSTGNAFKWSSNNSYGADTVTIVLPDGADLAGKMHLDEGDLVINKVTANQLMAAVEEGDVSLLNVTADGGKITLDEGDFMARQLTVNHHFKVVNEEGDNTVHGVSADGYFLKTDEGENTLFHQTQDSDDRTVLRQNSHTSNVLTLISSEGDNSVH